MTTPRSEPVGDAESRATRPGEAAPRRRRQRDDVMVPEAELTSYYGRNIVKPAPWGPEIPAYLFLGGLAAGSGLLAAGGLLSGRVELQRNARLVALAALTGSTGVLIKDLGKPSRFANMLRTVKLTSPMSVGSWILTGFGAFTGAAATTDIVRHHVVPADHPLQLPLTILDGGASLAAGAFSAPLAAYTAVLLSNTATPTWHAAYPELPFVFVGSGLGAAGGAAMITTSPAQTGPARLAAALGSALELAASRRMIRRLGLLAEPLEAGRPRTYLRAAEILTVSGATLGLVGGRHRAAAAVSGAALLAGSALTRFGVFEGGMASARDPKYTVIPQRERLAARHAAVAATSASKALSSRTDPADRRTP